MLWILTRQAMGKLTVVGDGRGRVGGRCKGVSALIATAIRVVILVIPHDAELLMVIETKMRCTAACKHRGDGSRRRRCGNSAANAVQRSQACASRGGTGEPRKGAQDRGVVFATQEDRALLALCAASAEGWGIAQK